MKWQPHVTVATLVVNNGKFLIVKERRGGKIVYNQPAGHLEANETLVDAAVRETIEETGWHVNVTHFLGVALYTAPSTGICYHRSNFIAEVLSFDEAALLDDGIIAAEWLSYEEIIAIKTRNQLRSHLVLDTIDQYIAGHYYPLDALFGDAK